MRPNKDEYFLNIAQAVALRSTCKRHQIGVVLVADGYIAATGYNGAPKGMQHCLDLGCMRDEQSIESGEQQQLCRAVHAEQNAMLQAASHGVQLKGTTLYCTVSPCIICAKMIINAGINHIVFLQNYSDTIAFAMLAEAGYKMEKRYGDGLVRRHHLDKIWSP